MTTRPQTRAEWAELLSRRVTESGLSFTRFAREVLRRDVRTVQRWIALEQEVPQVVQDFIVEPSPAPWPLAIDGELERGDEE